MAEINPIRTTPPLPRIERVKPDEQRRREQARDTKRKDEDKDRPDDETSPHIDEYA